MLGKITFITFFLIVSDIFLFTFIISPFSFLLFIPLFMFILYKLFSIIKNILLFFLITIFVLSFSYFTSYRELLTAPFDIFLVIQVIFISLTLTIFWQELFLKLKYKTSLILLIAVLSGLFLSSEIYTEENFKLLGEYLNQVSQFTFNIFSIGYANFAIFITYSSISVTAFLLLIITRLFARLFLMFCPFFRRYTVLKSK